MICSRLVCLKHIFYAVLTLLLLLCGLEVGLRVYDSYSGQLLTSGADDRDLVTKSWLSHHRLKPLLSHRFRNPDTDASVEIVTNSLGLRGPELPVPKPPGVYRIVCLGDENTFSAETAESDTFCVRLEELLQTRTRLEVEVVNAGVPGYCPLLSYLQLKHSLLMLGPDLVLLNFDMSDVADDHRYRRHTNISGGSLPLVCPHPDLVSRKKHRGTTLEDRFLILNWCRKQLGYLPTDTNRPEDQRDIDTSQGRYAWLRDNPPDWSIYIQQALEPIDQINAIAEGVYARFVVATYPTPWQVSAQASNAEGVRRAAGVPRGAVYRSRAPFEALASFLAQRSIAYCDTSPAFHQLQKPERLYLHGAPRFSRHGHELYARTLARYLIHHIPGIWSNDSYDQQPHQPRRQAFSTPP